MLDSEVCQFMILDMFQILMAIVLIYDLQRLKFFYGVWYVSNYVGWMWIHGYDN
jgi:hypothetical protein